MTRCMGCMKEYTEGVDVCPHCGYARGAAAREAYHLAPESILGGKYIVGRVLGFGGFGVTYIGYDAQLDRVVAIKEFLPTAFATRMPGGTAVTVYEGDATSQFGFGLERFVQEAQRLAQFNGIPGITDIYDTFVGNNTAYIVMQYLQGSDVKQALQAGGPMPYEKARDIVLRICDTLEPVHAKGIIHRDISPDNIFLTDEGEVKLLDFGAARYESSVNSKSLSVILKSGYAPEEQYRSRGDQGPWTDVYALAATFYKMLTGITPPDSMERAVKDEIKEPSKLGADIPQSAENALMNALNIRKTDRTQSVQEFKEALQADGVERVKVKARRAQTGKVPLPAVVALGIAGVLVVVFIVLNATGTVNIVGGAGVSDNFGAAGEGQLTVPDITGKSEEEARQALEELGLVLETTPSEINYDAPLGDIMEQEPISGRFINAGETVTAIVSAGTFDDNVMAGNLPDPLTLDRYGVQDLWQQLGHNWYIDTKYEYSDTVPEGGVIRYENEKQSLKMFCSAGPIGSETDEPRMRGAILSMRPDSGPRLYFAVAPGRPYVDGEDWYEVDALHFVLSVSADGASWQPIIERPDHSNRLQQHEQENNLAISMELDVVNALIERQVGLENQTLQFKIDMYLGRRFKEETHTLVESMVLPQTFTLGYTEDGLMIDSAESLNWDTIEQLYEDGTLDDDNVAVRQLLDFSEREEDEWMFYTPFLVKGNFTAEDRLRVHYSTDYSTGSASRLNISPDADRELILSGSSHSSHDRDPVELIVYRTGDGITSSSAEGGMALSYTMPRPVRVVGQDNSPIPNEEETE